MTDLTVGARSSTFTQGDTWAVEVPTGIAGLVAAGTVFVGLFVLAFAAWGAYAPLASAAVASGYVAAAGQNQHIQHLEGGIVSKILVREGERVTAGQTLFELDPTAARSLSNRLQIQLIGLRARATRLLAERDGATQLEYSAALFLQARATGHADILDEQAKEFSIRLERHRQDGVILRQRVIALQEQIEGQSAQKDAVQSQLEVVREERERKHGLLERGLTDRSEYTSLLRSEADLVGQLGQATSGVLTSKTQIVQAEEEFSRLTTQRIETAAGDLNDVRNEIANADERLSEASAVLSRMSIRSPSDGLIVSIAYNTTGSVVRPGETLLELLPTSSKLGIEARISPADIDVVAVGQAATLRFSSLNSTTPVVPATVSYISADRLIDSGNRQPYYLARLDISDSAASQPVMSEIYPGMPVEVFIGTGNRTFLEYVAKPLMDSFNRAFREQ